MPDITNIFDYIDFLESKNPVNGTANENRAFVFANVLDGVNAALIPEDIYTAFTSVGITIPNNVFNSILDNRVTRGHDDGTNGSLGDLIQFLATTSPIPSFLMPDYGRPIEVKDITYDFITYTDITYQSLITGDIITKEDNYLAYDDVFTPSELKSEIATAFATKYQARVISVNLKRSYQSLTV